MTETVIIQEVQVTDVVECVQQGLPGAEGNGWRPGEGAPADTVGNNGDFYFDTAAGAWYGPKAEGTWADTGPNSLVGPPGPSGSTPPVIRLQSADLPYTITTIYGRFVVKAAGTINLPANPEDDSSWTVVARAATTVQGNGHTIDGETTLAIPAGNAYEIIWDGTEFVTA